MEIVVRNVNQAFSEIFLKLKQANLKLEITRNGPAYVFPEPVITIYACPNERVLFHPGRNANPIFHLMEAIWMLAGRKDVGFLAQFNSNMKNFSDDGISFNAAYGYRWRRHFGYDQLEAVIEMIRENKNTRQAVVQIWDAADLTKETKDKACNTQIVFDTRNDTLNMTVFNRSNDIYWGAYGANAVHFSFLQEFIAHSVKLPVGFYRQISNNLHLYTDLYDAEKYIKNPPNYVVYDCYHKNLVKTRPIMLDSNYQAFLHDCEFFCMNPLGEVSNYQHPFFAEVARPMALVNNARRNNISKGYEFANQIVAEDWRTAVFYWIDKKELEKLKIQVDKHK